MRKRGAPSQERKECIICHEMFNVKGFGKHLTGCKKAAAAALLDAEYRLAMAQGILVKPHEEENLEEEPRDEVMEEANEEREWLPLILA